MSNISIPNVTITPKTYNGVLRGYDLAPNDGYVLHDNVSDGIDVETGDPIHRYSVGSSSCGKNYDFSTTELTVPDINGNMVTVTAYGEREFYAFPSNLVPDPENNIYGGNNHETI